MIKAFIFDLGNVIVPFEIDRALKYFEDACDINGEDLREKAYQIKEINLYHQGRVSADELFAAFKTSLNLRMDFDAFRDAWNSIFLLKPILSENLIERLSNKYRLIILSDTNQLHFDFVKTKFSILRYFDDFVLSHEVGALKPSPKMYQTAIEKAECLAEECFFTDDKLENVIGAKECGINAVQFISAEQFEEHLINLKVIRSR